MRTEKTLYYVANVRLPTEKAHGVQIIKMCEAFANLGIEVVLISPHRRQINPMLKGKDVFTYYRVKRNFAIRQIFNVDLLPLHQMGFNTGPLAYLIQEISFSIAAAIYTLNQSLVYTRSKTVAFLRSLMGKKVFYEAHDSADGNLIDKFIASRITLLIGITRSIEQSWRKWGGKTVLAHDGVSDEFFQTRSRSKARAQLSLPLNQKIILYTGNLYPWKGINTLMKAAKGLPQFNFYLVGGSVIDKNIEPVKDKVNNYTNIKVTGHQPYRLIPVWLKAADVLVLPTSAATRKGREDTSPLKLFEYMASRKPIVASDLPSTREILDWQTSILVNPDSSSALVKAIERLIQDKKLAGQLASRAYRRAKNYTWDKRAKAILQTIHLGTM